MRLYSLIMAVLLPVLLLVRLWRGERVADLAERLGRVPLPPKGPALWLHGASNGEITSARWLVEHLIAARPGLQVLITSNTVTARSMVRAWRLPGVVASLAPLDLGFCARSLLERWQPRALISLEAELWPRRFTVCARLSVPVVLIGARMSGRSYRRWQRLSSLAKAALGRVAFASAQDPASRDYLRELGLPDAAVAPEFDMKAQAVASLPAPIAQPRAGRAHWLLAASTHEGEDAAIIAAFAGSGFFTGLILAPRHPSRAGQVAALLQARDLPFQRRSQGASPGETPVFLADTLGEMDLWYAKAGVCVLGGTFADKGGHTPWEPARHGCAILHGPSVWNFAATFAALDAAGAAKTVTAASLTDALTMLDAAAQDRMAVAAQAILRASGDPTGLLARILTISRL